MNDEIKVNNFIRTNDGIKQIVKINTGVDKTYSGEFRLDRKYKNSWSISRKNIIKQSPDIIDLVQVGDYVNGYKVRGKTHEKVVVDYYCYSEELAGGNWLTFYKDNIKTIVTKEEFEKRMYKVGE